MTKEYDLYKDDYEHFCLGDEPVICNAFVSKFVGECQKIHLTVSTDPLPNAQRVYVCKEGYYRWHWCLPELVLAGGMFIEAEETVNKFFPDALTNGLDKPKPLWLLFKK